MKTAILFGATGLIGSHMLRELVADPDYDEVLIVVRKSIATPSAKVKQLVADHKSISSVATQLKGDDLFLALGTTRAKVPDQGEYAAIDRDYPLEAARIAKANGARTVSIVTAVGANPESKLFYVRLKGEVERELTKIGFEQTHIFQPSMLLGDRKEHRTLEGALMKSWSVVDRVLTGSLRRYRGIDGADVAKAMVRAAKGPTAKVVRYEWDEMQSLLEHQ